MKKSIGQVADIRTGYQFRGKVSTVDDANVSVIQIKDVDEKCVVHTSDLVQVRVEDPDPYLVFQGDILFLSRGHRQYATIVKAPVQDTIATGYFFIVRPRKSVIRVEFLAWTLNQPEFKEAMRPFVRGSHIPLVSKKNFQDIKIRVPPLDIQDRIMKIESLLGREKQLSAAILEKRQTLVQAVSQLLLTGKISDQGK